MAPIGSPDNMRNNPLYQSVPSKKGVVRVGRLSTPNPTSAEEDKTLTHFRCESVNSILLEQSYKSRNVLARSDLPGNIATTNFVSFLGCSDFGAVGRAASFVRRFL